MAFSRTCFFHLILLGFLALQSWAKDPLGDLIRGYLDRKTNQILKEKAQEPLNQKIQEKTGGLLKIEIKQEDTGKISAKDQSKFEELFSHIVARSLFERKKAVSIRVLLEDRTPVHTPSGAFHVYGTSFGKPGNKGESSYFKDGTKVKWGIVTAALPDNSAVGKDILVRRPLPNGKFTGWVRMTVRDLGPWFRDDPYWSNGGEPRAVEYFRKKKRRWDGRVVLNPAGIDLTPWAWQKLGIARDQSYNYSGYVEWKFVR